MKTVTEGYKDKANQDFPHTSSDADIGNGVENSHMSQSSEQQAKRDDLSRNLEGVIVDAKVWLELSNDSNAKDIVRHLETAFELLGKSIEASSDEELDPNKVPSPVRGA